MTFILENQGNQEFNLLLESCLMRRFGKVKFGAQEGNLVNIRAEAYNLKVSLPGVPPKKGD